METTVSTVVRTTGGALRGTHEDGVFSFRGIPYAEAPVGDLRFRPAQRRAPWDGVLDATRFGATQLQDPDPVEDRMMNTALRPAAGPDCLNLNVWTPEPGGAGLPVFVWIHGGSLKTGTGADALYDGARFARDGVVTVTINYRLHAAGYLYVSGRPGAGAFASCPCGGHEIWWTVTAEDAAAALRLLPHYVAERSTVTRVEHVPIP